MPKKTKNRSSKQAKQRRQTRARIQRTTANIADEKTMLDGLRQAWNAGAFPMVGPDGETRMLTLDQITAQWNTELTSDGEPPVVAEEIFPMLEADVFSGALWLLTEGRWMSTVDYFANDEGAQA